MKKKEVAAAIALLTASSALCLRLMKKVDEKLRREKEKRTRKYSAARLRSPTHTEAAIRRA